MARIVSNTPSTTIPSKRKGKQSNQIIGYNSKAIKATGQQMTNKNIQNKKANMIVFLFHTVIFTGNFLLNTGLD